MKPLLDGYPEQPLVSIIIPCYNAERWLSHAILSCLEQTYRPIEIIVIDDGSTDGSLDIIKSYDKALTWETGPNRGGNAARNRGFALSKGEYIQFLDADDYLLPEKIERQVRFLEETGADVVYGDWRHQFHEPDRYSYLGRIIQSGVQEDILVALLSPWWVAVHAVLMLRSAVARSGMWDEQIHVGQDKDFLLSLALSESVFAYQPGCYAIYRRYGNTTVSTSDLVRHSEEHLKIYEKAERYLLQLDRFTYEYRKSLAISYYWIAIRFYHTDYARYKSILLTVFSLDPDFRAHHSTLYNQIQALLGFRWAQRITGWKRCLQYRMRLYEIGAAL
jgi:glycosyltransferase involved in cell wall biosynthesis